MHSNFRHSFLRRLQGFVLPAALMTLLFATSSSRAAFITYSGSGSGGDGAISASASFTITNGQIVLTLTNTLAVSSFVSPGQALSQIVFTLSNAPGATTITASGQFGDVGAGDVVTYVATDDGTGQSTPQRWITNSSISSNTVSLTPIGGGQPSQMISPNVANGGVYTNANNGVPNFNSYVIGTATFTMSMVGVTANTDVTAVTFRFGTSNEWTVTGSRDVTPTVPEPATMALAISGLGTFGIAGLRRLRRKQVDVTA